MSKLKHFRERADSRLDRWDAQIDALEAQLEQGRDEVMARVHAGQKKLSAAADRLKDLAEDAADLTADEARALRADLDELRVQLALGKAESRDAFDTQRKRMHRALDSAEERFDSIEDKLEARFAEEVEGFVRLADRLRAELEAAELQFSLLKAGQRDALAKGQAELRHKLAGLRAAARRHASQAADRIDEFEDRLEAGIKEFREGFEKLIGG